MRQNPTNRSNYNHFSKMSTRWNDNDIYGHLNNVIYYELFDTAVNKWLISNPSFNLIDIKYKLHYNNNVWTDVVIVVYESSQEPFVDWHKGEQQA